MALRILRGLVCLAVGVHGAPMYKTVHRVLPSMPETPQQLGFLVNGYDSNQHGLDAWINRRSNSNGESNKPPPVPPALVPKSPASGASLVPKPPAPAAPKPPAPAPEPVDPQPTPTTTPTPTSTPTPTPRTTPQRPDASIERPASPLPGTNQELQQQANTTNSTNATTGDSPPPQPGSNQPPPSIITAINRTRDSTNTINYGPQSGPLDGSSTIGNGVVSQPAGNNTASPAPSSSPTAPQEPVSQNAPQPVMRPTTPSTTGITTNNSTMIVNATTATATKPTAANSNNKNQQPLAPPPHQPPNQNGYYLPPMNQIPQMPVPAEPFQVDNGANNQPPFQQLPMQPSVQFPVQWMPRENNGMQLPPPLWSVAQNNVGPVNPVELNSNVPPFNINGQGENVSPCPST